jgi:hypothetical protein
MRRFGLVMTLLAAIAPATASADSIVGAPLTHGPDPASIATGPQAPSPSGGPIGATAKRGVTLTARSTSKLLPTTWCGPEQSADDTADEVQNGGFKYHAVYMVAADAPDRFGVLATQMQTDAFQASALLEASYGRAIRFDMGTSCGPQYLDISVVRMPQTLAEMAALAHTSNGTFDAVSHALDAAGFQTIQPTDTTVEAAQRTRNYLVWLDAPAPSGSCGQAAIYDDPTRADSNLNNYGGKAAIVFRNGPVGFCSSNAARHEIGHNLGALQRVAPHAFDGAHCNDAYEDTMCYSNAPQVANGTRGLFFDYGNDDYWDPPHGTALPWWTVNLNQFLCPDAGCNVAPGAIDNTAPVTPAAPAPAPAAAPVTASRAHPRGRVWMRATRLGRGVWRLRLRATGHGHGVVIVRCRERRYGQMRTVFSRNIRLPRILHGRVRCVASRPRAKLLLAGQ